MIVLAGVPAMSRDVLTSCAPLISGVPIVRQGRSINVQPCDLLACRDRAASANASGLRPPLFRGLNHRGSVQHNNLPDSSCFISFLLYGGGTADCDD